MFINSILIFILAWVPMFFCLADDASAQEVSKNSVISGTITEISRGTLIRGAEVLLASDNMKETVVRSDSNGNYEFSVVPGIYSISVEEGLFHKVQRSEIAILEGERLTINFRLQFVLVSETMTLVNSTSQFASTCTYTDAPKSTELQFDSPNHTLRSVSIVYGELSNDESGSVYRGSYTDFGQCKDVIRNSLRTSNEGRSRIQNSVFWGRNSVYSDQVRLDPESRKLLFKGKVTFENGMSSKEFCEGSLSLLDGKLEVIR